MSGEKPNKDTIGKKREAIATISAFLLALKDAIGKSKVLIAVLVLMVLLTAATSVFELPRWIEREALGLIWIGFFLFALFDSLRSKRCVIAVLSLLCIVWYLARIFL